MVKFMILLGCVTIAFAEKLLELEKNAKETNVKNLITESDVDQLPASGNLVGNFASFGPSILDYASHDGIIGAGHTRGSKIDAYNALRGMAEFSGYAAPVSNNLVNGIGIGIYGLRSYGTEAKLYNEQPSGLLSGYPILYNNQQVAGQLPSLPNSHALYAPPISTNSIATQGQPSSLQRCSQNTAGCPLPAAPLGGRRTNFQVLPNNPALATYSPLVYIPPVSSSTLGTYSPIQIPIGPTPPLIYPSGADFPGRLLLGNYNPAGITTYGHHHPHQIIKNYNVITPRFVGGFGTPTIQSAYGHGEASRDTQISQEQEQVQLTSKLTRTWF